MQSFKLFLTFSFILTILFTGSAFAAPEANPPPVSDAVPAAQSHAENLVTPDKPREYFGYAWPFADRDLVQELGQGPVVVELFTTQGCIFCPVADKFFTDLISHAPGVIGLACHVTYLNVTQGNLSTKSCTDRQFAYTKSIVGGSTYTPQIVVNGRKETFGFQYEAIYSLLKEALKNKPVALAITKGEADKYAIVLPDTKLTGDQIAELQIIQYRKPLKLSIADGPNQNMGMEYFRSVSSITNVEISGKGETIQQEIVPEKDTEGFVAMIRVAGKITAVGEVKF